MVERTPGPGTRETRAGRYGACVRIRALIPREHEPVLGQLHTNDDVVRFARSVGIAPGIVVGRLQHMRWWKHSEGHELLERFDWPPS